MALAFQGASWTSEYAFPLMIMQVGDSALPPVLHVVGGLRWRCRLKLEFYLFTNLFRMHFFQKNRGTL